MSKHSRCECCGAPTSNKRRRCLDCGRLIARRCGCIGWWSGPTAALCKSCTEKRSTPAGRQRAWPVIKGLDADWFGVQEGRI